MAFIGAHVLIYSSDAQATREALRDIFGFKHIDAGDGWLIFRLPPAELGIHPTESHGLAAGRHAVSLICDDIHATVRDLRAKGIEVGGEPARITATELLSRSRCRVALRSRCTNPATRSPSMPRNALA